jgi:hypothetical protein
MISRREITESGGWIELDLCAMVRGGSTELGGASAIVEVGTPSDEC